MGRALRPARRRAPPQAGGARSSLSLPKLNARFLSPGDYLLRNFRLFRLESADEIRGDIVDVIRRMRPARRQDGYVNNDGDCYGGNRIASAADDDGGLTTEFRGWARMGLELGSRKRDKPRVRLMRVDPRKHRRMSNKNVSRRILKMASFGARFRRPCRTDEKLQRSIWRLVRASAVK